jgi:hypothetical protein
MNSNFNFLHGSNDFRIVKRYLKELPTKKLEVETKRTDLYEKLLLSVDLPSTNKLSSEQFKTECEKLQKLKDECSKLEKGIEETFYKIKKDIELREEDNIKYGESQIYVDNKTNLTVYCKRNWMGVWCAYIGIPEEQYEKNIDNLWKLERDGTTTFMGKHNIEGIKEKYASGMDCGRMMKYVTFKEMVKERFYGLVDGVYEATRENKRRKREEENVENMSLTKKRKL